MQHGKSVVYLNRLTGDPKQPLITQPAIVISTIHSQEFKAESGEPGLNLMVVAPGKESMLGGADFTHALERIYGVKHANHADVLDGKELAHYTLDAPSEEGRASYSELQSEIDKLANFLNQQFPGEVLMDHNSIVDATIALLKTVPSGNDLDKIAGEQQAKAATAVAASTATSTTTAATSRKTASRRSTSRATSAKPTAEASTQGSSPTSESSSGSQNSSAQSSAPSEATSQETAQQQAQ